MLCIPPLYEFNTTFYDRDVMIENTYMISQFAESHILRLEIHAGVVNKQIGF